LIQVVSKATTGIELISCKSILDKGVSYKTKEIEMVRFNSKNNVSTEKGAGVIFQFVEKKEKAGIKPILKK
jgi:hypothetical protein